MEYNRILDIVKLEFVELSIGLEDLYNKYNKKVELKVTIIY
ncbi:MAG: hypothetical protein ACK4QL_05840 [Pseudanabaenaceae cyanobacterium]